MVVKNQVFVMPSIARHHVTAPPRLVWVNTGPGGRMEKSKSIAALRYVAIAAVGSAAVWAALLAVIF